MFDFNVLEGNDGECKRGESFESTDSTASMATTSSKPSTRETSAEENDSESDIVEEQVSQSCDNKTFYFDFDELEEAEAAVSENQDLRLAHTKKTCEENMANSARITSAVVAADAGEKAALVEATQLLSKRIEAVALVESSSTILRTSVPQHLKLPRKKTLFLFDWDDTLCPTSWIENRPEMKRSAFETVQRRRQGEDWESLAEQARAVSELVHAAQALGSVAFVTLAQRPWVNVSIRAYMSEIKDELCKVDVFYARESIIQSHMGCPWTAMKRQAMQKALTSVSSPLDEWDSLISIGDSEVERRAALDLGRELQSRGALKWTKTVKLTERPSVSQLTSQVRTLREQLVELAELPGHRHIDSKDWLLAS